jgi:hypothetical protein
MATDLQLIEGETTNAIQFLLKDVNGDPDDLTQYTQVRLVMTPHDYSVNSYDIITSFAEMDTSLFAQGILKWIPSIARPVPAAGFYWLQIIREVTGPTDPVPVRKWRVEVVRRVPPA